MICLAEINCPKCPQHPESMFQLQSLRLSHFHPPVRLHVAHVGRDTWQKVHLGAVTQVNSVYPRRSYGVEGADVSLTWQACLKPRDGVENLRVVPGRRVFESQRQSQPSGQRHTQMFQIHSRNDASDHPVTVLRLDLLGCNNVGHHRASLFSLTIKFQGVLLSPRID